MAKVIMIQGLPGSGKTTLATMLKAKLDAVHINADWARKTVTSHLGFTDTDRVTQARTLGQMARMLYEQGKWVIVDFVNPLPGTRIEFQNQFLNPNEDVFSVWTDTIDKGRFADTNAIYQKPSLRSLNYHISGYQTLDEMEVHAQSIFTQVTAGHRTFYIRYNTHCDGAHNFWRVIDAETLEETLVDDFEVRGLMVPGNTVEHGITKFNVSVTGYHTFEHSNPNATPDGLFTKFKLWY